jgi:hypothetical protein
MVLRRRWLRRSVHMVDWPERDGDDMFVIRAV